MNDLQILMEEVARIALEDERTRSHIGNELDVSDEELQRLANYLNSLLKDQS
jgi:DNA-binding transcriptional regulator LsrR (DeoR family)